MMNHKRFLSLFFTLLLLISSYAHSIPLSRIYGEQPRTGFINNYFSRLYKWHATTFETYLTVQEKKLLAEWSSKVTTWGLPLEKGQLFPYFTFTHTLKDGKLEKPALTIALSHWPAPLREQLLSIAKKRKAPIKPELAAFIFGISWHPENKTTEIFYLHTPQKPLPEVSLDVPLKSNSNDYLPERLYSEVFDARGKKISSRMILPLKKINWHLLPTPSLDALSAQEIESSNGDTVWKMDLRSLEQTLLPPSTAHIAKTFSKTFLLYPDSLTYKDINNHTLFYP